MHHPLRALGDLVKVEHEAPITNNGIEWLVGQPGCRKHFLCVFHDGLRWIDVYLVQINTRTKQRVDRICLNTTRLNLEPAWALSAGVAQLKGSGFFWRLKVPPCCKANDGSCPAEHHVLPHAPCPRLMP